MPRRSKPRALEPGQPLADNPVPEGPHGERTYGAQQQERDATSQVPMAAMPAPGAIPLIRATERPAEPLTEGLPMGPGAGPEALAGSPTQSAADQLMMLANGPEASPRVAQLAQFADRLGV